MYFVLHNTVDSGKDSKYWTGCERSLMLTYYFFHTLRAIKAVNELDAG